MAPQARGRAPGVANLTLQLAVRRPGVQVAIFAPSFRQASILSRKVRHLLAGSKWQRNVGVDNVGELRLRFGHDARGKPVESVILTMSLSGKVRGEGAYGEQGRDAMAHESSPPKAAPTRSAEDPCCVTHTAKAPPGRAASPW